MIRYRSYVELLRDNNINYSNYIKYATDELNSFLECIGSDIVDNEDERPKVAFKVEVENIILSIGVTSMFNREGNVIYFYWLIEKKGAVNYA